ncbi:MAG TPA: cupin domain-containing protein [Solirubrobacteraceae bacterium]
MQTTGVPGAAATRDRWAQPTGIAGTGTRLVPWPVPSQSIIEGSPHVTGRILARNRRAVAGLWECEPGRIEFVVDGDELLVVLTGRLVIQTGQGETIMLESGDVACLPDGTDCVVTVSERCRCAFQAAAKPLLG